MTRVLLKVFASATARCCSDIFLLRVVRSIHVLSIKRAQYDFWIAMGGRVAMNKKMKQDKDIRIHCSIAYGFRLRRRVGLVPYCLMCIHCLIFSTIAHESVSLRRDVNMFVAQLGNLLSRLSKHCKFWMTIFLVSALEITYNFFGLQAIHLQSRSLLSNLHNRYKLKENQLSRFCAGDPQVSITSRNQINVQS